MYDITMLSVYFEYEYRYTIFNQTLLDVPCGSPYTNYLLEFLTYKFQDLKKKLEISMPSSSVFKTGFL